MDIPTSTTTFPILIYEVEDHAKNAPIAVLFTSTQNPAFQITKTTLSRASNLWLDRGFPFISMNTDLKPGAEMATHFNAGDQPVIIMFNNGKEIARFPVICNLQVSRWAIWASTQYPVQ